MDYGKGGAYFWEGKKCTFLRLLLDFASSNQALKFYCTFAKVSLYNQRARFTLVVPGVYLSLGSLKQNGAAALAVRLIIGSWQLLPIYFVDIYSVGCHSVSTKFKRTKPGKIPLGKTGLVCCCWAFFSPFSVSLLGILHG